MKFNFRCFLSLVVGLGLIGGTIASVVAYGFADDVTVAWFCGVVVYGLIEMLISSYMGVPCIKKQARDRSGDRKSSGAVRVPDASWTTSGAGRSWRRQQLHSQRATAWVDVRVA